MKIIIGLVLLILGLFLLTMFTAVGDSIIFPLLDKVGTVLGKKYGLKAAILTNPNPLAELVGKSAITLTDLLPSGKVQIMGRKYNAIAIKGSTKKRQEVTVSKVQGNTLYVTIN